MKKYLGILAIAGVLVACNNSAESTDDKKDSLDSLAKVQKEHIDSSAEAKKDVVDSVTGVKKDIVEKQDSLNKRDSANRK